MKRVFFALVLVGSVLMSGCALNKMVQLAKDQQLTVTPSPLEVHKDTVNFEMSALLPLKMLKKGKVYTLKTAYKYGEKSLELEDIQFKAEDYPNSAEQQPKKSQTFSFPYSPELIKGDLVIKGVASDPKNGKTKEGPEMEVAEGVITTSKLVEDVYYAAFANHGYNTGEEIIATKVEFFFDQGRSELKRSELKSERGAQLDAFIAEKNVTRTVTITGTHSPEGTERINSGLAGDRAEVIKKYYSKMMKKYDYKGMADSIKFIIKPVVEDWTEFKELLKASDVISKEEKDAYLSIVNGSGSFEDKEDKMGKLPSYKKVFDKLYPTLRTAKTEILSVKPKKTEAEISVLAKQVAVGDAPVDTLSDEELMYGATLTPDLDEKEKIYEAATKDSDSWNSHNNLGTVYLLKAIEADSKELAEKALTQFDLSIKKKESAEAYGNMGVVYLMQGNPWKAQAALNKAFSLRPSNETVKTLAGVKGAVEIMIAKYTDAVSTLSDAEENADNLFNKGLAQLLNSQFQNAITTFDEVVEIDGDYAMAYYAAAVSASRAKQDDIVYAKLKLAYDKDPELKKKAMADLEFRNYWSTEEFTNALK